MDSHHCEEVLLHHGIRPTAVRMLVLDAMERFSDTFTLADLEEATDGMDRSSIYRTLTLFVRRHLLHLVEDGSGSAKYCSGDSAPSAGPNGGAEPQCRVCIETLQPGCNSFLPPLLRRKMKNP